MKKRDLKKSVLLFVVLSIAASLTWVGCGGSETEEENVTYSVEPMALEFSHDLEPGETEELTLWAGNKNEETLLRMASVEFSEDTDDAFSKGGEWEENVVFFPGDSQKLPVVYAPQDHEIHRGTIVVTFDQPERRVIEVPMTSRKGGVANDRLDGACLEVAEGEEIDFSGGAIGETTTRPLTLINCSPDEPVSVDDVTIDDGGDGFSLDAGSATSGLIEPGEALTVSVEFAPTQEETYQGSISIESTDEQTPSRQVTLTGQGMEGQCPVAVAGGRIEGSSQWSQSVAAQIGDTVELSGVESSDPAQTDITYQWRLVAYSAESNAQLEPSRFTADPTFKPNTAGTYVAYLVVASEAGIGSCEASEVVVEVVGDDSGNDVIDDNDANANDNNGEAPDSVLITVSWVAPEVVDEHGEHSQGTGTDLSTHYLHPDGDWEDTELSVYWRQRDQDWGAHGEAALAVDDIWGTYGEEIIHQSPQDQASYRLGVHYYDDKDWGASDAVVKVYFGDDLYAEYQGRLEATGDLWEVGTVDWSDDGPSFDFIDELHEDSSLQSGDF